MCGYRKIKTIAMLLILLAGASGISAFSVHAALKAGSWQVTQSSTGEINGTSPMADNATIPVYQGSVQLDPAKTYTIPYSATPGDFSVDATADHLILTNPHDTEGDSFGTPPELRWENQQVPGAGLIWADAATPDTPLEPQPVNNKSFCAQNLAGRHLVAWPRVDDSEPLPQLYLSTLTGTPTAGTVALQDRRVALDITQTESEPLAVSASHYDSTLKAAKVKAGESITLTIATHDCAGNALGNVPFTVTRSDALNRQGSINNDAPVQVDTTELTTNDTQYHGVTDASGTANVTVTQDDGPGVKTTLRVKPENLDTLETDVDVIFTTLTSPNSDKAAMWGHMAESTTVKGFTFSRPVLATETSGADATVTDHNEVWAQFTWSHADNHCASLLPDLRHLIALDLTQQGKTVQETLGWPLQGNYYWSGTAGDPGQHFAVDMRGDDADSPADSERYLVSCVDQGMPAVTPKITLTPDHFDTTLKAAKVMTSESVTMTVAVTDSVTDEPIPYAYYSLSLGAMHNRANATNEAWETSPIAISGTHIKASDAHFYQGVTDASGMATVVLTQPQGQGVRTTVTAAMREGYTATDEKDVIFTVITSPDSDKAQMWGHMKDAATADGHLFIRPLLAAESGKETGTIRENGEDWATYHLLSEAENQCGDGQIPSANALEKLYAGYSTGGIATVLGWPTEGNRYLAADTDGTTYHNVSLKNGNEGSFTGSTPNYLSCAATELVAQLQVTTNGDATQRLAKVKAGESITLDVQTTNSVNGLPAPNIAFTVTSAAATNRQKNATGLTSGGPLIVNGQSFGTNSNMTGTYQGVTDAQGKAQLVIEQPGGPGVKTPLTIKLTDSRVADPVNYDVIFTTVTSPDTDNAQMWGHMKDSLTVGNDEFQRPKLKSEATSPISSVTENNEVWVRGDYSAASKTSEGGCDTNHMPGSGQLLSLYSAFPDNTLHTTQGWPTGYNYISSSLASVTNGNHYVVDMIHGAAISAANTTLGYIACLKNANPQPTQLILEVVDSAQWSESLKAAKARKEETLRLKATVKDSAGNPVPDAAIVLSRGSDYSRKGDSQTTTSMVINGQTAANTSTLITVVTGADGSVMLDVKRPNTTGTKATLQAKLYDNASVTASMDTIFTVITSPDSSKATFWGHMPETATAEDGSVFKRPLLYSELNSTSGFSSQSESNELWAKFKYAQAQDSASSGCGNDMIPAKSALMSLYNANPGGTMSTTLGWPHALNYWSNTGDSTVVANRSYKLVNLYNGTATSGTSTQLVFLTCLSQAHQKASLIELTSPQYDARHAAASAHKGDKIALQVVVKDAQGNRLPNTAFIITHSYGRLRSSTVYSYAYVMTTRYAGGQSLSGDSSSKFFGVTDDSGQAQLEFTQNDSTGYQTVVTATLDENAAVTGTMPAMFTIVTSPDSDKAKFWGHMPETITASSGQVFHRPWLAAEISGSSQWGANGEYWARLTPAQAAALTMDGCTHEYQAQSGEIKALYNEFHGDLAAVYGWPTKATDSWWLGADKTTNSYHTAWTYPTVNLYKGSSSTTDTSAYGVLCVSARHTPPASITLSADAAKYDSDKQATVVKKGELIHLTVTTKDSDGEPASGDFMIKQVGDALNRAGVKGSGGALDLQEITPVIGSRELGSNGAFYYGSTGSDGIATFTVSQNASTGLKTSLLAQLDNNASQQSGVDTIFTVLTSPDSTLAQYWGHMPETVTSSSGLVFHRPLLAAEISGSTKWSGNNESWARLTPTQALALTLEGCTSENQAQSNEINTLYNEFHGDLASVYGWPTTASDSWWRAPDKTPDSMHSAWLYPRINLKTGANSTTDSVTAYGILCVSARHTQPASITMSVAPEEFDADKKAAVVKKGEPIHLTVMAKDSNGNAVPRTAFTLRRGDATNRAGKINTTSASYLSLQELSPGHDSDSLSGNGTYYLGITGDDGNATFTINQDASPGLKIPLSVQAEANASLKSTLDTIYTVVTSPDSDKAAYWGHMPETFTASNGTEFSRPLLYDEYPTAAAVSYNTTAGEKWPLTTPDKMNSGACTTNQMPLLSDLQSLYADHPNGNITTDLGLPAYTWWSGDEKAAGLAASAVNYQYLNMKTGAAGATTTTSATNMQVCLTKPRGMLFTVTFPTAKWDAEKQATVVGMNEKVSATVAVTDTSGKPVSGALVRISAGGGVDRKDNPVSNAAKTVTETAPVQASGNLLAGGVYNGVTGDDGKAVFDISQAANASKETLTFSVGGGSDVKTQDIIVTTPNSPDSPYAKNWGSMAETIEVNGVTYKRPILLDEYGTPAAGRTSSGVTLSDEVWATFTPTGSSHVDVVDACGSYIKEDFPQVDDIKEMYTDKRVGSGAAAGWPYATDGSTTGRYLAWNANTGGYQLINMTSGAASLATVNSNALVSCPVR